MGMYTEFIFEGEKRPDIPEDIQMLFNYFFGDNEDFPLIMPDHDFFKCLRWGFIGHMASHYFIRMAIRIQDEKYVFLRCDLKNYFNEIHLFSHWIKPYMKEFRAYKLYEDDEYPIFFNYKNGILTTNDGTYFNDLIQR